MNTVIHHKGQSYVVELIPFERRIEMLKEKYNSLTIGTFYGMKPKEYDKIIVKLEWIFRN